MDQPPTPAADTPTARRKPDLLVIAALTSAFLLVVVVTLLMSSGPGPQGASGSPPQSAGPPPPAQPVGCGPAERQMIAQARDRARQIFVDPYDGWEVDHSAALREAAAIERACR